jgi:cyclomaltodextrinase / maltogenic alpha-amylase / neopullulanase
MTHWTKNAIFYHIYPLGLCGAPRRNPLSGERQFRLRELIPWLDHAQDLGATAILLGPVMESGSHGYDVADYFTVDRRLGDNVAMARLSEEVHNRGLKLVLDGVFNHAGREFAPFRDVREKGKSSAYADWFYIDFGDEGHHGDRFSYRSWNGCDDLVKLNTSNAEVRKHIFQAVSGWIKEYQLDGLRLDAADHLDMVFVTDLAHHCRGLKDDFWLMGEVVKGPYTAWLQPGRLDSVTDYECYKALFSSHNDGNYHELGYCLRRHYAEDGLYGETSLYTFADNHDVPRVASRLVDGAHLYPLYCLLFTIPGIPSIYYGSEYGARGEKAADNDWPLRPHLDLAQIRKNPGSRDLARAIATLAHLRRRLPALTHGNFTQIAVAHRHLVFSRRTGDSYIVVGVSSDQKTASRQIVLPEIRSGWLVDRLNRDQQFEIRDGKARIDLWPNWARIMELQPAR